MQHTSRHLRRWGCSLVLLMLMVLSAQAQVPPLRRAQLPTALIDAPITALLQDHRGYLWGATPKGLLLFSGTEVRLVTTRDSLAENHVTALYEDRDGQVWIGHRSGAISRYDGRHFAPVELPSGNPTKEIRAFTQDSYGQLWVATKGEGLYYKSAGRLYLYSQSAAEEGATNVPPSDEFYSLLPGAQGDIWAATDAGMTRLVATGADTTNGKHRIESLSQKDGLPDNYVKHLALDTWAGVVWVTMQDSGVATFDPAKRRFARMRGLPRLMANATLPVEGGLWVALSEGGLLFWERKTGRVLRLTSAEGLSSNSTLCLLADREGSIWAGGRPGLTQILGDRFQFLSSRAVRMPQNITSVFQDRVGELWVGSDSGLTRLSPMPDGGLRARRYLAGRGKKSTFVVVGLTEDTRGRLWVGTNGEGLYMLDAARERLTPYGEAEGLSSNDVTTTIIDSTGTLWVGTLGGGVNRLDLAGATPRVRVFTSDDGLAGDYILQISAGRDRKTIWVATAGNGIARFTGGKWTTLDQKNGLSDPQVLAVREGRDGTVYALTVEAGLFRLTRDAKGRDTLVHVTTFAEEQGAQPKALAVDSRGRLILPDFRRLGVYEPGRSALLSFDAEDGLANFEPSENATYVDRNGVAWIGTKHGLVRFDPNATTPRQEAPSVVITRLQINQQDAALNADTSLNYSKNSLSFTFVAANLSNPQRVVYSYRLRTESDTAWLPPTRSTSASFPNLQPGSYVLEVRASVQEGLWTPAPAQYRFTVEPPWWMRWEFITGSLLALIVGTYLFFQQRVKRIRAENIKLEQKVQERTAEVVRQKDEIEAKNSMLEDANEEITAKNEQISMALREIEQKNTEITESIQYARRIQQSILPDVSVLRESFADVGVYYQARDIVSGDFYWYARSEGKLYLGAVDCTGHGVPGAFMSVMAYNLLNQTIKDRPGCSPEAFLEHLDHALGVALQLRKDGEAGTQTNDGMDIALVVYDPAANTIAFAGAMRPLYYVRGGELHEVRGARFPIGGTQYGDKVWEGHVLSIEPGDQYYITSDGLVDQFGGPNGRKFTPAKLKKLLVELKDAPLQTQADSVKQAVDQWMQGYEQLDDLMLVGIRPR